MLDIKLYRKEKVESKFQRNEKIKIDNLDIPIIDFDNAFLYEIGNEDYIKTFHLPEIDSGLTFYKNQYYYFDHNIVEKPKGIRERQLQRGDSNHSYNVYPITDYLSKKIINSESVSKWEVLFNSFYNYGEYYLSIRRVSYVEWYKYTADLIGDSLFIPYGVSPSDMNDGQTIVKYLEDHSKQYKNKHLILNKKVVRDSLIKSLV